MPRFPSAQDRLNHDPGFPLSCDENLSEGWGPPLTTVMAKRMTSDELRAKLEEVDRDQLASLITQLADEDDGIRDRAEALALRADPAAYVETLRRRLERWERDRHFISYSESTAFARQLDTWLAEVEEELLAVNPEATLKLADAFIRSDRRVLDRADDSNGSIGDAYRRACGLWLVAAAKLGASPTWVDRLHDLHADNGYGVRDALLDDAGTLLSELELRRLARRGRGNRTRCRTHERCRGRDAKWTGLDGGNRTRCRIHERCPAEHASGWACVSRPPG